MDDFVGSERRAMVADLEADWDAVCRERRPRTVVLLGETGFGKTRIVQEFYAAIAARQPDPPYWPATITEGLQATSGEAHLNNSRKAIVPWHQGTEGVDLPWLWMGAHIDEGHGRRAETAIAELTRQIGVHLGRALERRRQRRAVGTALARATIAALPIPDVVGLAMDTHDVVSAFFENGGPTAQSSTGYAGSVQAFWKATRQVWKGRRTAWPVVLVVEDGHAMGPATAELLDSITTSGDLPFLVVVCAQESRLAAAAEGAPPPALAGLLSHDYDNVRVVRLSPLAEDDVATWVRSRFEDLDATVVDAIAEKAGGNPYSARSLMLLVQRRDARRVTKAWVDGRPSELERQLEEIWSQVPEGTRRILTAASLIGHRFPAATAQSAFEESVGITPEWPLDMGWLRRAPADDEMLQFLELARWTIARHHVDDDWDPDERAAILREGLRRVEDLAEPSRSPSQVVRQLHVSLALSAAEEGVEVDTDRALQSAVSVADELSYADDDLECLDLLEDVEKLVARAPGEDVPLLVRATLARRLAVSNLRGATSVQCREIAALAAERAASGPDPDPAALGQAWAAVARSSRKIGDDEALAAAEAALRKAETFLAQAPTSVEARIDVGIARYLMAYGRGDVETAAQEAAQVLELRRGLLGPLNRATLGTLMAYGFYLARTDPPAGVAARRQLLAAQVEAWGDPGHRLVATAKKELASSLLQLATDESLDEARAMVEEACQAAFRARGPRSEGALRARGVRLSAIRLQSDRLERLGLSGEREALLAEALEEWASYYAAWEWFRPDLPLEKPRKHGLTLRVRLGDETALEGLVQLLADQQRGTSRRPSIEVRWTAVEVAAGHHRLGRPDRGAAVAAELGLSRVDGIPATQTWGWTLGPGFAPPP